MKCDLLIAQKTRSTILGVIYGNTSRRLTRLEIWGLEIKRSIFNDSKTSIIPIIDMAFYCLMVVEEDESIVGDVHMGQSQCYSPRELKLDIKRIVLSAVSYNSPWI